MNQFKKAQLTVSILACFSLGWGFTQNALATYSMIEAIGVIALQLVTIIILSVVLLAILKWVDVFDVKTNTVLTLITVVTLGLALIV
ncbi:MAG: hypothetical protein KGY65_09175 [Candidatus Thermoplasmatota archaeon]|nr:hypothetical protein [Candidatus Thermoplasmatota archaeon]MBS3802903.1 hypothetical protein [Candidatus Thermoplasmatota archaeon]